MTQPLNSFGNNAWMALTQRLLRLLILVEMINFFGSSRGNRLDRDHCIARTERIG